MAEAEAEEPVALPVALELELVIEASTLAIELLAAADDSATNAWENVALP